jgi:cobalamin biosynthesis Mg chelatase CobN
VVTTPPADTTSTTDGSTTTDVQPPVDTSTPPPESTTESSSTPVDTPVETPVDTPVDTPSASTSDQSAATSSGVVVLGPTSIPAENASTPPAGGATSGTRESAETTQSAASVNIPGKEIEVLPIGLGVFAGISVIALIVVGLVTYERTKYRKAFRARRLAASGAEMGYGGMSERR